MILRKLLCLFFFALLANASFAQNKEFILSLTDSAGNALNTPSVVLSYTVNGQARMQQLLPEGDKYKFFLLNTYQQPLLEINALGFYPLVHAVQYSGSPAITLSLKSRSTMLTEVKIKSGRVAIVKGDTTIFALDKFSTGGESVAEDIIKKLPGARVDEQGNITFNGKQVNEIRVNGDNFTDDNYKLISKNLSAASINKASFIENVNDNAVLTGIKSGVKTILDLQLRNPNSVINEFNVAAGLGVGSRLWHEARVNYLGFNKKLRALALGNANNIGHNPFELLESQPQGLNAGLQSFETLRYFGPYNVAEHYFADLDIFRNNFNNAWLGSAVIKYSITPKSFIRLSYTGSGDNNRQQAYSTWFFNAGNTYLQNTVTDTLLKKRNYNNVNALYTFETDSQKLMLTAQGNVDLNNFNSRMLLQGIPAGQRFRSTDRYFYTQADYTRRLSAKLAFQANLRYSRSNNPQAISLDTLFAPLQPGLAAAVNYTLPSTMLTGSFGILGSRGSSQYTAGVGGSMLSQDLQVAASVPAFNYITAYKRNNAYGKGEYRISLFQNYMLSADGLAGIEDLSLASTSRKTYALYKGQLSLTRLKLLKGALTAAVSVYNTAPGLYQLVPLPLLRSYRTVSAGTTAIRPADSFSGMLFYNRANYGANLFLITASANYTRTAGGYYNNESVYTYYTYTGYLPAANDVVSQSAQINLSVEKFLNFISGNLYTTANKIWLSNYSRLNGSLQQQQLSSYKFLLGYKSGWLSQVNINFNSSAALNKISSQVPHEPSHSVLQANFINRLTVYYTPHARLNFELSGQNYLVNDGRSKITTTFVDFLCRYHIAKNKAYIDVSGVNLLNNKTLTYKYAAVNSYGTGTYMLLPRQLMLKVFYRF